MVRSRLSLNSPSLKIFVIALLIILSAALAVIFHFILNTDIVYTHFFYIPIVLASIWWGRRGMLVGLILAVIVFSFQALGLGISKLLNDLSRVGFFMVVAFFIGILKEKVVAGQRELQTSEEKYRLLIDKSIAGIFVYDNDVILFANSRFGEILGINPADIVEKSIWDFIFKNDSSKVKDYTNNLLADNRYSSRYECRLVGGDGSVIWVDVASSITNYAGKQAIMANVYDITESKEAVEKQRKLIEIARTQEEQLVHSTRLAELGEMAAGISHELNQPLTGIRNYSKNALYMIENNVAGPEEINNNLRLISEQVDRASKIINKMREFTRRSEMHFIQIDLNSIIRESMDFITPQLRLAGITVTLELDENLPMIVGDKIRLEQVLLNLLTNAKQAMEDKEEGHLTVRTYYNSASRWPVFLEVEDTGKGFQPEVSEKLFAPFYTTKETGHGTGLGLSISLSIVKDHGGNIKAYGKPDNGAIFTIMLPVSQDQNNSDNEMK
ncbi:MAG: PAS domain S-box protein [Spirochaetota bacterium]|nr:MAG: PAS domain S-box protein [Spirochaetota bacterium]